MTQSSEDRDEIQSVTVVGLTAEQVEEIDRNARAYGWEIGHGQPLGVEITTSADNPFLDPRWRDAV